MKVKDMIAMLRTRDPEAELMIRESTYSRMLPIENSLTDATLVKPSLQHMENTLIWEYARDNNGVLPKGEELNTIKKHAKRMKRYYSLPDRTHLQSDRWDPEKLNVCIIQPVNEDDNI